MFKRVLATEEVQGWLSVLVMHDCLTGSDGIYDPLLLDAVNNIEDLAASAIDFTPAMWLIPLLDCGNEFGAVISESVFAAADISCNEF